jgi:hypothetical protein
MATLPDLPYCGCDCVPQVVLEEVQDMMPQEAPI